MIRIALLIASALLFAASFYFWRDSRKREDDAPLPAAFAFVIIAAALASFAIFKPKYSTRMVALSLHSAAASYGRNVESGASLGL
jgi:glucan phosphoethanolaminetransferase (alkaline phosphatase superfamily)